MAGHVKPIVGALDKRFRSLSDDPGKRNGPPGVVSELDGAGAEGRGR